MNNAEKKMPQGYSYSQKGLCYEGKLISGYIEVLSTTCEINTNQWGRQLRIKDINLKNHVITAPMALLANLTNDLWTFLLSHGLFLSPETTDRRRVFEFIHHSEPQAHVDSVDRVGWHNGCYVTPKVTYPRDQHKVLNNESGNHASFIAAGNLQEWQRNVADLCRGNSRLIMALSTAFAPPLLKHLNIDSFALHFKGRSSIGKSTMLNVASSVWGSKNYTSQWRLTDNALEGLAESRNDALLSLDEIDQVDAKQAGKIVYMIANGSGKLRATKSMAMRKSFQWQTVVVSTGEVSIEEKVKEAGKEYRAGMAMRMIDIQADTGVFGILEELNGHDNAANLIEKLKNNSAKFYGSPINAFLEKITSSADYFREIDSFFETIRDAFSKRFIPENADPQIGRVAEKFCVVIVAGCQAVAAGILPFKNEEIFESVGKCFLSWLEDRGSAGAYEIEHGIKKLQAGIISNLSRFANRIRGKVTTSDEPIIHNQLGFKEQNSEKDGYEIFLYSTQLAPLIQGFGRAALLAELTKRGMLIKYKDGYAHQDRINTIKSRYYHFTDKFLSEIT